MPNLQGVCHKWTREKTFVAFLKRTKASRCGYSTGRLALLYGDVLQLIRLDVKLGLQNIAVGCVKRLCMYCSVHSSGLQHAGLKRLATTELDRLQWFGDHRSMVHSTSEGKQREGKELQKEALHFHYTKYCVFLETWIPLISLH